MRLEFHCGSWLHVIVDTAPTSDPSQAASAAEPPPYDTHSTIAAELSESGPNMPVEHDGRVFVPSGFHH